VKFSCARALLACCLSLSASGLRAAEPFTLAGGDRVVLVGNTLIEREQRYGYWETALTRRHPDRSILFRNLGWSGDTVFGDARAGFGTAADGFRQLREHVLALKPTVLILGYGTNESFDGPAGLPRFLQGLNTLLDTLAPTKARVVLLSPLRQENLGRPLPDPAGQNKNLRLYADALRDTAMKRGLAFVDLFDLLGDGARAQPPAPLTANGIHLTAWGYWRSVAALEKGLGLPPTPWRVELTADGNPSRTQGCRVTTEGKAPLHFQVTDALLPEPAPPREGAPQGTPAEHQRVLRVQGLAPGSYTLTIDGKAVVSAPAAEWGAGVALDARGPEYEQVERLRATILAKNRLYFYRWRPENETYLFGFRKHEQGQNAREIPRFDPLVEDKEAEIVKLRVPAPHEYELTIKRAKP
jgi:lysophospholipase L1-like esterase